MQYIMGLISLIIALLGVGVMLTAGAMGIMFSMHKYMPHKLPQKNYGDFNFDSYEKKDLQEFIIKLLIIFVGVTLILHALEYLVIYRSIIRHWMKVRFALFVFETAGIAVGLFFVFKLDRQRLVIITGGCAILYLFFQWLLVWSNLLI